MTAPTIVDQLRALSVGDRVFVAGYDRSIRVTACQQGKRLGRAFICNARKDGAWVERTS